MAHVYASNGILSSLGRLVSFTLKVSESRLYPPPQNWITKVQCCEFRGPIQLLLDKIELACMLQPMKMNFSIEYHGGSVSSMSKLPTKWP
jgi:hypothetical protein